MKILIIGSYSGYPQLSMQKFCSMIEQGMSGRGHEVRVIRPEPILGRFGPPGSSARKWLSYADKFLIFPAPLRRAAAWADVVHICDHSNAIYTRVLGQCPHVVTCHDLMAICSALGEFSENPVSWTGRQYQRLILAGLNRARFVACDSHQTRLDLLRHSRIQPDHTTVIFPGLNYAYAPMPDAAARQRGLGLPDDRPFVLHVGCEIWYKNRLGVLSIFQKMTQMAPDLPPIRLVMVGTPLTPEMHRFLDHHGLGDRVLVRESVTDEDLRALYSRASALLFPSLYEGFGWPVIEAQVCGCPVVCSREGSLDEVGGDGALKAAATDEDTLARLLLRVIVSPEDRAALIERGFANVERFSTEQMIEGYESTYRKALGEPGCDGRGAIDADGSVPKFPKGQEDARHTVAG